MGGRLSRLQSTPRRLPKALVLARSHTPEFHALVPVVRKHRPQLEHPAGDGKCAGAGLYVLGNEG